jgi:hypothetical protein
VSGDIVPRTTIADNEANRRRKRIIVATPARPSKEGVAATFELDGTAETTGRSVKHFTLAIMIRDLYGDDLFAARMAAVVMGQSRLEAIEVGRRTISAAPQKPLPSG